MKGQITEFSPPLLASKAEHAADRVRDLAPFESVFIETEGNLPKHEYMVTRLPDGFLYTLMFPNGTGMTTTFIPA